MPVEGSVHFLNVDLLIGGRVDRRSLLQALGGDVFAVHEDAVVQGKKCLLVQLARPGLDLVPTLSRLVAWVERLPPRGRRSWKRSSIRQFDIGIQAGRTPHETHWVIPPRVVAALARIRADVALTVYGAEWSDGRPQRAAATRKGATTGRRIANRSR
jgi:hypothetical protein